MRYGVAADVHGNLPALLAVLEALHEARVDRILCPGDVVGYGPHPDACAQALYDADALVVAGNHDLMAIGELPIGNTSRIVRRTIEWTRGAISDATRSWLAGLPLELQTEDGVVMTHGGLGGDTERYVRNEADAEVQLATLAAEWPGARGLLIGHTHLPMEHSAPDGRWLLNPGSVGQSREHSPVARALVFDAETGPSSADFIELHYDVGSTRRELRAEGLPPHACHLAPGRVAEIRRRVTSLATGAIR
jgi:predicted phosphodiesterase